MSATPPLIKPTGLHELVLEVADLEASTQFYEEIVGLTVIARWEGDRQAVWFDMGDTTALGLWTVETGGEKAIAGGRGGVHVHFALRIPQGSIDDVQTRIESLGITIVDRVTFDDGNRSLYIDDPDGNCVELMDAIYDWSHQPIPNTGSASTTVTIVSPDLASEQNGYLETIGRTSGQTRLTEIWFTAVAGRIYLLSGLHNRKDWIRNLTQTPRVRFRIRDHWYTGTAHIVEGDPAEIDLVRFSLATKYYGGDLSAGDGWLRVATPFAIDLDPDSQIKTVTK